MSVQLAIAPGALVSLGVGAGDVAAIIDLGRRIGNWWTGVSGDKELLELLNEDDYNIVQRRGLLDISAFNGRWRKSIRLLDNSNALDLQEEDIQNILPDTRKLLYARRRTTLTKCGKDFSLFTGIMTCLIAVLDQFAKLVVVNSVIHNVLRTVMRPNDNGVEILRSQITSRLNSWRSVACIRGFNHAAQSYKLSLIEEESILPGHMPATESLHMEQFLVWLLATNNVSFKTSSSDVAGVAACLAALGLDSLGVEGSGFSDICRRPCKVLYSKEPFLHNSASSVKRTLSSLARSQITMVPLDQPWESVSIFPIRTEAQNRCRMAWQEGQKAAKAVRIGIYKSPYKHYIRSSYHHDLEYMIADVGRPLSIDIFTIENNNPLIFK